MISDSNHIKKLSYAKCIDISKKVRWDIENDVIKGRQFDLTKKFLPDGISKAGQFEFLNDREKISLSQVQGRTYANMFGFVERFIVAKVLELTSNHWLGDQAALEAMVRFCDEELKHQELFRRIDQMMAGVMPDGYRFLFDPNEVAAAVLSKSTWAVMALILEIELFTREHYKQSIEPDNELSDLYKDIFLFHWMEETTHAMIDELEWPLVDEKLTQEERDKAVTDVIDLVTDVDGILKAQSESDTAYFAKINDRQFSEDQVAQIRKGVHQAYRWQYIFSGVQHPRFVAMLCKLTTEEQRARINDALSLLRK
ncbi:MAG: hypothetical protein C4518_05245 [Desulfobacteraceae bacterium]|nr:MAG: hypothetical protein C4518_05245 [Desulfobacteraceae bacterium]